MTVKSLLVALGLVIAFAPAPIRRVIAQDQDGKKPSKETMLDSFRQARPRQALEIARLLTSSNPDSGRIQALLGIALLDCGLFEQADESLHKALVLDRDSPEAHLGLGELAHARLHLEVAADHLAHSLGAMGFEFRACTSLASCLSALNRHQDAKRTLARGLEEIAPLSDEQRTRLQNNIKILEHYGGTKLYQVPDSFRSTTVTFKNSEGHILVPAKLNGDDTLGFHLDTGGSGSLTISRALGEKLKLKTIGIEQGRNVVQVIRAEKAMLDTLQVGELVLRNVPVSVLCDDRFATFKGGASGNMGREIIQKLNMTVDYPGIIGASLFQGSKLHFLFADSLLIIE